jgi:hypothetical protein
MARSGRSTPATMKQPGQKTGAIIFSIDNFSDTIYNNNLVKASLQAFREAFDSEWSGGL